jgi:hypothetical protein
MVRETARERRRRLFAQLEFIHGRGMLNMGLQPGGLRWGFEFADGSRVSTLDPGSWRDGQRSGSNEWTPKRPVLTGFGRPSESFDTWSREVWLWPLPPQGPVRVVCLWPDRGIAETSTSFNAAVILAAAEQATPLWPTDDS